MSSPKPRFGTMLGTNCLLDRSTRRPTHRGRQQGQRLRLHHQLDDRRFRRLPGAGDRGGEHQFHRHQRLAGHGDRQRQRRRRRRRRRRRLEPRQPRSRRLPQQRQAGVRRGRGRGRRGDGRTPKTAPRSHRTPTLVTSAVATTQGAKTDHVSSDKPGNASSSTTALKPTTTLKFGDTILYKATYSTANLFGTKVAQDARRSTRATRWSSAPTTPAARARRSRSISTSARRPSSTSSSRTTPTRRNWTPISAKNGQRLQIHGAGQHQRRAGHGPVVQLQRRRRSAIPIATAANNTVNYYDLGYWHAGSQGRADAEHGRQGPFHQRLRERRGGRRHRRAQRGARRRLRHREELDASRALRWP